MGFVEDSQTRTSSQRQINGGGSNGNSLQVTYSIPTAPTAPTNLSTITGIPIELDWDDVPTSGNGGSPITGYKVFRTLNEFALTELPDNSGSDSQITFTSNELLLHGFSGVVVTPTTDDFSGYADVTAGNAVWSSENTAYTYVDTTNDVLHVDQPYSTGVHAYVARDMGANFVDSNKWITQWKMNISTAGVSTLFGIGFGTNDETTASNTSENHISFQVTQQGTDGIKLKADNSAFYGGVDVVSNSFYPTTGTDYWYELIRDGSTATLNVYSDSTYSTLEGTASSTITATGDLRYFKIANVDWDTTASAGDTELTIDDWNFYNGVSSTTGTVTIIPDSSTNGVSVTQTTPATSTTGTIGNAIASPNLSYSNANLPSGTAPFSVGGWVGLNGSPTDTKLLNINDVTFTVGTTSASVDNIVSPAWDSASAVGFTINGATVTPTHTTIGWNNWIRTIDSFSISNGISFPYSLGGTSSPNTNQMVGIDKATSIPSGASHSGMDFAMYTDGSGIIIVEGGAGVNNWATHGSWSITDTFSIDVSSSGVVNYMKNGVSLYTSTNTASGSYYFVATNYRFGDITNDYQTGGVMVSATGLTDNTVTPQHYSFTRDSSNLWTIYQNGISKTTATDATSLGSSSETVYWESSSNTLCTISGSSATHTGTSSSPSECRSMGTVGTGDSVIFTQSLDDSAKTGLSAVGSSYGSGAQNDIGFGIYFNSANNGAYMMIGGSVDYLYSGGYSNSDNWKMTVNSSGNIEVYQNNVLRHTFTTSNTNTEYYLHTVSAPANGYQPVITSDLNEIVPVDYTTTLD